MHFQLTVAFHSFFVTLITNITESTSHYNSDVNNNHHSQENENENDLVCAPNKIQLKPAGAYSMKTEDAASNLYRRDLSKR